ncbi:MAG TPA: GT4 family glycosyltransferase PelF [Nitrosopumilaceae archaeon]|nr:GT4 family glycosyltransferase PelF [Nitrosopumilaceae archaeon]
MLVSENNTVKEFSVDSRPLKKLLLVGWDAYPHVASGGVYRWQRSLIEGLTDWQFIVFNQLSNPNASANNTIHNNVKVIGIPIFATNRYEEFYDDKTPLISRINKTTQSVIKNTFLPLYDSLIGEFLSETCNLQHLKDTIFKIHSFFTIYDYKKCLENPKTWEIFRERLSCDPIYKEMNLHDALEAFRAMQRSLQILSVNIPKVDLVQCSLAWFPALLGMIAKKKWGCPVVVSEHGVAFREVSLNYNIDFHDKYTRILVKTIAANVVKIVHSMADVVVAASRANTFWQQMLGVPSTKMKLIYNGIDTERFKPMDVPRLDDRPTLVSVARIEPFKDVICLIEAIKYVKEYEPNVRCLIYGESKTLDYATRCVNILKELQLEETIKFMGGTSEPEKVFNAADVVVISSITEGLPLTACESMACGKAVVASDVGGTREAVQGCGILVKSRNPHVMANAIITLLKDEKLRNDFGADAMKKSRAEFSVKKMVNEYSTLYESLIRGKKQEAIQLSALQEMHTR